MGQVACARCGDFVEAEAAQYSDAGQLVCGACTAKAEIASGNERAARAIFSASWSSVGLGLAASFVLNPCFSISLLGIASAVGTFVVLSRNPEQRVTLGRRLPVTIAVAVTGLALSLAAPLIQIALLAATGYGGVL